MSEIDPFVRFLAAYADAVARKDAEAFAALYAEPLRVFDLWQDWQSLGLPAWHAMARDWFGSLGDERVEVTWAEPRCEVDGSLAAGHAFLTYTAYAADGTPLRSLDNRITVAMRRGPDGWKVVHEHTSAPVAHGSGTAVLRRESQSAR